MEKSQELLNKVQRIDNILRVINILGLLLIIVFQALTTVYVINRINAFERAVDCKLLILPEDRSKAKLIECSELNAQQLIESPIKKEPEILQRDSTTSTVSKPFETYYPLSPINEVVPNTAVKETEPKEQLHVDTPIPTNPDPIKYTQECIEGRLNIRYIGTETWVRTQQACTE